MAGDDTKRRHDAKTAQRLDRLTDLHARGLISSDDLERKRAEVEQEASARAGEEAEGSSGGKQPGSGQGARVRLHGLSVSAYEHPADRAALTTLRKVPGFDLALRKLIALVGERSLRYLHLASAVRVTSRQFARLNGIYAECLQVLDLADRPDLFVAQTPMVNAGAMGVERPFIVLNSGALELLDETEVRFILGHELGHVLSEHVLYKTMLALLVRLSLARMGIPIGAMAIFALVSALREWDRKSELSADRAGLLCLQDPEAAARVMMKMAGGGDIEQMRVEEFVSQAEDYEQGGDLLDGAVKLINLIGASHPEHAMRLLELRRWIDSGAYEQILAGEYCRRDHDPPSRLRQEVAEAARSYREAFLRSKDPLMRMLKELDELGVKLRDVVGGVVRPGKDDEKRE